MQKPSLFNSVLPLIFMFLLISYGSLVVRLPLSFLLIVSAVFTGLLAKANGLTVGEMMDAIADKVRNTTQGLFLVLCIGGLVSSWILSGTIPMFIYYGIKLIDPQYFYITAFLLTALASTVTGTSYGSAGTIGVAVMGVAAAQGLPLDVTAGAVISGAIFGDKMSPCSDTTVLAALSTRTNLYTHIRHMFYTTGGATLLCLCVYGFAGFSLTAVGGIGESGTLLADLEAIYDFSWLLLLPAILVLAGSVLKKPTIPIIIASSFLALFQGVVLQGFSVKTAVNAYVKGFSLSMLTTQVPLGSRELMARLLNRGGMESMLPIFLLVFCVFAFAGIYSRAGYLTTILENLCKLTRSPASLIAATLFASLLVCLATGSTYLSILLLGELFGPLYQKMNLASENLSRTLEDAGTCAVPLIPWSITATYLATTIGVPTVEYLPWAVLCYSGMAFALVFAYSDFRITRLSEKIRPAPVNDLN